MSNILGFNKELAWQRASRHKFGFVDTSVPGDILKPAMYFKHSQEVDKLSKVDILKLFVGKIAIQQIQNIDKYIGIIDEQILKKYYGLV